MADKGVGNSDKSLSIEDFAIFCKKKGFIFKNSEIYGGLAGVHDYGPIGSEMKRNLQALWWQEFVRKRPDMVGIDGSTISHSKVWEASGHVQSFNDPLVMDLKTKKFYRADHLIEDALRMATDGKTRDELQKIIKDNALKSPDGNDLSEITSFNLMFPVSMGAKSDSETTAYLRGETAQNIFIDYKSVIDTARVKLPFGIAQIGRSYRNEISPRDFIFRQREFEIMELEYFYNPENEAAFEQLEGWSDFDKKEIMLLTKEEQEKGGDKTLARPVKVSEMIGKRLSRIHAYWLVKSLNFYESLGIRKEKLRVREHTSDELSHYSSATFDVEYEFPFGFKEIEGIADRGNYDLSQHEKHSKQKMAFHDDSTGTKVVPHVIEPSFGFDRLFLALLIDSYDDNKERGNIVLHLKESVAPVYAAVMPLVSNKDEIVRISRETFNNLINLGKNVFYDKSGSIGRRYARQDEIGTPYCITIDHQSIEDSTVTIRYRDSKEQKRVAIKNLWSEING